MSIQPGHRSLPIEHHRITAVDRVLNRLGAWVVALLTHQPTRHDRRHRQ
ncbi:hypothetical protein HNR15_003471 [Allobranchiibius huperziae]|uniref:Uncharacterized protein n=1 Tax=Allobranchiibius huperziae TaxID=1874116 RepID=A0A853DK99_9MICO|nr:hypothetical protein [Allobranchiibius huperziae]